MLELSGDRGGRYLRVRGDASSRAEARGGPVPEWRTLRRPSRIWRFRGGSAAREGAGIALVAVGSAIVVVYRDPDGGSLEEVHGSSGVGMIFELLGGLGAAGAALITRPAMASGFDPAAAAVVRASTGLAGLLCLCAIPRLRSPSLITGPIGFRAAASGLLGMGLGMTLVLLVLSSRSTGIVTSLASSVPARAGINERR